MCCLMLGLRGNRDIHQTQIWAALKTFLGTAAVIFNQVLHFCIGSHMFVSFCAWVPLQRLCVLK